MEIFIGAVVVSAVIIGVVFWQWQKSKAAQAPIIAQGEIDGAKYLAFAQWCADNNVLQTSPEAQAYLATH